MVLILLLVKLLWPSPESGAAEDQARKTHWTVSPLSAHEVAACFVLVAMPLVVYIASFFFSVPFYTRYLQPVVIGFTVIIACFACRIGANRAHFQKLLISLLVWFCLLPWVAWQTCKLVVTKPASEHLEIRPKMLLESPLPIVFDNSESDFMEFYYYCPPAMRSRVYGLLSAEESVRFSGTDTGQRSLAIAQTIRDVHAVDYGKFLSNHREFLVVRMGDGGWVLQSLISRGAHVTLADLDKDRAYFVRSVSVYRVVIPDQAP
jgi:hypothetical protein